MERSCPKCSGTMRPYYLNVEEALWMCDDEEVSSSFSKLFKLFLKFKTIFIYTILKFFSVIFR